MEKTSCKIDHSNIAYCNDCFLLHERMLNLYKKDLLKWDEMIDEKKEQFDHWCKMINDDREKYINLIAIFDRKRKELSKVLKEIKIKQK